jgi:hypothetical protein
MANRNGSLYGFTGLFPIKRGAADELREFLRHLDSHPNGSPLFTVDCIHLARFVVVTDLPFERFPAKFDSLRSAYLLVMCDFDGESVRELVDALVANAQDIVVKIWGRCRSYPGADDAPALDAYFRTCQLKTNLFLADQEMPSVQEILRALELQRRFTDFVQRYQGASAEVQQAEFEKLAIELEELETTAPPVPGMVTEQERQAQP